MLEILDTIKKLLGIYNHTPDITSRKRRLSRDSDSFQCKMRRLDDFTMPTCSSPLNDIDTPSSSNNIFKKPSFPVRPYFRPTEIIDLSDDDDYEVKPKEPSFLTASKDGWVDARKVKSDFWAQRSFLTKQAKLRSDDRKNHNSVLRKAKNTLTSCNNFISGHVSARKSTNSVLNESIRIGEKQRYKEILESIAKPNSKVFSYKDLFGTEKKVREDEKSTDKKYSFSEIYRKRFEEVNDIKTIDLSDDRNNKPKTISIDSDSDSDVKFVSQKKFSPVNSLKKRLEIEPVMNHNWISEWTDQYSRTTNEKKKQIEEVQDRRDRFRDVNKENAKTRLEETLKSCLRLQEVILLDDEPEEALNLPELTEEQERMIHQALKSGPGNQVFIDKFNLRITRKDLQTLRGLNWLNDEVINFYTNLISERGNGSNPKLPRVHSMNTFFYPKLITQGYNSLRRWTKKVDIFAQDMLVIPIHLGVHWCMAIVDFRIKTIRYYDSMGSENPKCLKFLLEYLQQEHNDKKKSDYNTAEWKTISVRDIPQQMNGSDCGMFACMYAEFLTRNAKILFTQENMPYFRLKMVYEIITGQLLMK